ncbi:DHS-like NAD/FAD-binding domain-containing protein [Gautieria morchelliformis]|nr:DHS-like NAD/FAD-binding domain-containing protein [Gautieria morchelliformis]
MTVTLDSSITYTDSSTRRSLTSLSTAIAKSKRIVVVTGAGISCSCGIPDFRSSDGLYALVKSKYPNAVLKGRDLFDASLFRDMTSTALFYTFMAELKSSIDKATPSPTHRFIKTLDTKGKLLRSYTQNIDGFEERVGLVGSSSDCVKNSGKGKGKIKTKDVRNVQLHGDIHRLRCLLCAADFRCTSEHLECFREGDPPDCPECRTRSEARVARSARPLKIGTLRPCVVLYDEPHPLGEEIGAIETTDLGKRPDMLLIMGTSLKVHGLKKLVKEFAHAVHEHKSGGGGKVVFVNKTPPGSEWTNVIDFHVAGETDAWTAKVIEDWKKARPQDWEVQKTLSTSDETSFKVVKQPAGKPKGRPSSHFVSVPRGLHLVQGGKSKKKDPNAENVPPIATTVPPGIKSLPTAPLSPSKRNANASHYDDTDNSPSKRRTAVLRPSIPDNERGMLFNKPSCPVAMVASKPQKINALQKAKVAERANRRRNNQLQDALFIGDDLSLELPIIVVE